MYLDPLGNAKGILCHATIEACTSFMPWSHIVSRHEFHLKLPKLMRKTKICELDPNGTSGGIKAFKQNIVWLQISMKVTCFMHTIQTTGNGIVDSLETSGDLSGDWCLLKTHVFSWWCRSSGKYTQMIFNPSIWMYVDLIVHARGMVFTLLQTCIPENSYVCWISHHMSLDRDTFHVHLILALPLIEIVGHELCDKGIWHLLAIHTWVLLQQR